MRAPLAAPRLRYSKPVNETVDGVSWRVGTVLRLGKAAEAVVDTLECGGGWMSVADLAADLGLKRSRDLRRRTLPRLKEAEVVECSGDDVRLRLDWSAGLERKREIDGEISDYQRDEKKYAEESRVYALKLEACKLHRVGCGLEDIAGELEIGMEDVYRLLDIPHPAPHPAPSSPTASSRISIASRIRLRWSSRSTNWAASATTV